MEDGGDAGKVALESVRMLLVGQLDSPFVRRVAVSMTFLGRRFERDRSSVFSNFEDVSRINPLGRVPALVLDDGTVLVDSTAILDWLDGEVGPERALMPPPGPARIACWRLVALGLGANEKLVTIVYEHLMRQADQRSANWIERCRGQIERALATLDEAAGDISPWLLGDRLTQADITVATMLGFLRLVEPATGITPPDEGHWAHLKRLAERCEAEAAFAACFPPESERPLPPGFSRA
jgi:glutathione S-transferase